MSTYFCPNTQTPLREASNGLVRDDGWGYPYLQGGGNTRIPNFLSAYQPNEMAKRAFEMYDQATSGDFYRNFLDWLFQTFDEDEHSFRQKLAQKLHLKAGDRVLVTGCGLGDDIGPILDIVGETGQVYANDLSPHMVVSATHAHIMQHRFAKNISFSICDATQLPFAQHFFDAAYHFGGINLFSNVKQAIGEMTRVVKPGGRVVFGDEGIAPWLKNTEYAKIAVTNNALWAANAPIDLLPAAASDVNLSWVLGNCFYIIDFQVAAHAPQMNMDVMHKGRRGGSMRTRYFGQLEGVTDASKTFVLQDAAQRGISVHDWLEQVIQEKQRKQADWLFLLPTLQETIPLIPFLV